MDDEILGYVVCKTCMKPKSIKQGKGKRKAFVHGRCKCGPDTRTGGDPNSPAQLELKAFKPLAEVEAEIEALKQPKPEPVETKPTETKTEPMGTVTCVGVGAVTGLIFGAIIKSLKAVA